MCLENGGTQLNGSVVGAAYFVDGEALLSSNPTLCKGTIQSETYCEFRDRNKIIKTIVSTATITTTTIIATIIVVVVESVTVELVMP